MKPLEIKGARTRLGFTQQYMAEQLGCPTDSYRKKESGVVKFTDAEKIRVTKLLRLTYAQMNDFLYDGVLPEVGEEHVVW